MWIWPLNRGRNGPNSGASVSLEATFDAPSGLFRQFLYSTLAICPCDTPHTLATLQSPADFLRVAVGDRPAKSPPTKQGSCWQPRVKSSRLKGAKSPITMVGRGRQQK